jgi:hypothetical protein
MKTPQLIKKKNLCTKGKLRTTVANNSNKKTNNISKLSDFQKDVALAPKYEYNIKNEQLKIDIESLTKTELSKKYGGEHNSWKDAKYRCKNENLGVFDPRFNIFSDFLSILGPKPSKEYTLDRIDHANPEYSPENTRWASKQLQSLNRKNTRYLTNANTGESFPLTIWAQKLNISPATIRSRLSRGCSDHEALFGKSSNPVKTHKNNGIWQSFVPHLDPNVVESEYLSTRLLLSRYPDKQERRQAWLYRMVLADHYHLQDKIFLVHNPEEPDLYPVPPQMMEKFNKGLKLIASIKHELSDREIEIAHLKVRGAI